jgi:hypothetical protein
MEKSNAHRFFNTASIWIFSGIPILILIASLFHFIYEWSGRLTAVGIFAPINESVWEHLKMTFWPMLIWWITGYFVLSKKNKISAPQWFVSCAAAELACPLVIVSFYYIHTEALGIESFILDIFSLILGVIIAQILAHHLYKYGKFSRTCLYCSIIILILLITAFTVFTFIPPQIPLFKDFNTGKYGI